MVEFGRAGYSGTRGNGDSGSSVQVLCLAGRDLRRRNDRRRCALGPARPEAGAALRARPRRSFRGDIQGVTHDHEGRGDELPPRSLRRGQGARGRREARRGRRPAPGDRRAPHLLALHRDVGRGGRRLAPDGGAADGPAADVVARGFRGERLPAGGFCSADEQGERARAAQPATPDRRVGSSRAPSHGPTTIPGRCAASSSSSSRSRARPTGAAAADLTVVPRDFSPDEARLRIQAALAESRARRGPARRRERAAARLDRRAAASPLPDAALERSAPRRTRAGRQLPDPARQLARAGLPRLRSGSTGSPRALRLRRAQPQPRRRSRATTSG